MVAQELAQEHTSGQNPGSHGQPCFQATALTLLLSRIGLGSLSETERQQTWMQAGFSGPGHFLMPVSTTPSGNILTSYHSLQPFLPTLPQWVVTSW